MPACGSNRSSTGPYPASSSALLWSRTLIADSSITRTSSSLSPQAGRYFVRSYASTLLRNLSAASAQCVAAGRSSFRRFQHCQHSGVPLEYLSARRPQPWAQSWSMSVLLLLTVWRRRWSRRPAPASDPSPDRDAHVDVRVPPDARPDPLVQRPDDRVLDRPRRVARPVRVAEQVAVLVDHQPAERREVARLQARRPLRVVERDQAVLVHARRRRRQRRRPRGDRPDADAVRVVRRRPARVRDPDAADARGLSAPVLDGCGPRLGHRRAPVLAPGERTAREDGQRRGDRGYRPAVHPDLLLLTVRRQRRPFVRRSRQTRRPYLTWRRFSTSSTARPARNPRPAPRNPANQSPATVTSPVRAAAACSRLLADQRPALTR